MKIKIENLSFSYNVLSEDKRQVLADISFEIGENELVGIIGHSGSGKTTLIQHFTGLLKPTSGKVWVDGQDLWGHKIDLSAIRRKIGIVFQFPETQLFEEKVFEDIAFGPKNLGLSKEEITSRVRKALELIGLDFDLYEKRNPHKLSEGEKRRVALAGVIAMNPKMLVLDEPTAGLDPSGIRYMNQILKKFYHLGKTVIIVSHNLDEVVRLVERVLILDKGKLVFDGKKEELFSGHNILEKLKISRPRCCILFNTIKSLAKK